jgi:uncharacterized protein (TIGR04255 family)
VDEAMSDDVNRPKTDVPLGGLPPADRTLLPNAPLDVAVVDVRYTAVEAVPAEIATAIRDALEATTELRFPHIRPTQQQMVQIEFGPDGSALSNKPGSSGWQIQTVDADRTVTVMADSLVLQTAAYERWSVSLGEPLAAALAVVQELLRPQLRTRLGLRYIDRFRDSSVGNTAGWRGRIRDEVLGPMRSDIYGHMVRGSQQQLELDIDGTHRSIIRHGFTSEDDRSVGYLLDIDVFNELSTVFEPDSIIADAVRLNRTALSLFQSSIELDYLRTLQSRKDGQ